ncbi:MAG: M14 family zinc carboxypeptidase [candidate division WOR-3 bacterium]|nr:M14 family zinc carboxypeptidase [candidate division WOR-3 bacterium]
MICLFPYILYLISETILIDPRYHTYEEVIQELDSIATHYPSITKLYNLGFSTRDSLPIFGIKISDNPAIKEDEPAILFNGIHHAEELLGCEVCLYLLNDLVSKYGIDSAITCWINNAEIWIIPVLNPEGHNVVMNGIDTIWRKNKRDNNNNGFFDPDSDGVDLNRNYDFNWELGGSPDPANENYRGPYPFSENETKIIRNLASKNHFVFDVCYHCARTGQGELVYYPWRWGTQFAIDHPFIKRIADTLASKIINDAGNGTYVSIYGYATEGTARNWLYGVCGTFAYTIELSRSCYPPGYKVDSICMRNLRGAYYLLERTFGPSITGIITDSITGQPLVAEIRISGYYDPALPPRTSDSLFGRYRRILNPGTYTLKFIKSGYDTITVNNVVVSPGIPTILNIKMRPLGIEEDESQEMEDRESSLTIHPNPFRNKLNIRYRIHDATNIGQGFSLASNKTIVGQGFSLAIYDISGRIVKSFNLESGIQHQVSSVIWDGTDDRSRKLPSGVYFVRLEAGDYRQIVKAVMLK